MKKIIIISILIFTVFTFAKAQQTSSAPLADLVIVSPEGQEFVVYLNDQIIDKNYKSKVIIADLAGGYYNIAIYFTDRTIKPILKQITVYTNSINVYSVVQTTPKQYTIALSNYFPYISQQNAHQFPVPPTPKPQEHKPPTPQNNNIQQATDNQIPKEKIIGCPAPISEDKFQQAINSIKKQTFEQNKLQVAKQIAKSNCLTSAQVKKIMKIFTFEDMRLEFAKFAYNYVYDPENFYIINDTFEFSSSVDALNYYINKK